VILSQDVRELTTSPICRVHEAVEQVKGTVRIGDRDVTAGQLLERLGFTKQRVWTPVAELSGGERRRLQLLRLLMGEPNVLMLDEPTNDLDTDTLAAVEDALDGWPGTLLVVSHDRYLLERVTDRQIALLGDGGVRDLPGGVEEYLRAGGAARRGWGADGWAGVRRPGGAVPTRPMPPEARRAVTVGVRRGCGRRRCRKRWPSWSGSCPAAGAEVRLHAGLARGPRSEGARTRHPAAGLTAERAGRVWLRRRRHRRLTGARRRRRAPWWPAA
jgi:energy-coupling factor transporter ATP-binding protein EcfA2